MVYLGDAYKLLLLNYLYIVCKKQSNSARKNIVSITLPKESNARTFIGFKYQIDNGLNVLTSLADFTCLS